MEAPLIALRGVTKRFPGVLALDRVDLTVRAGEIHALLGENGAGKSTLIKILTGAQSPDSGTMHLAGEPLRPAHPADAEKAGISTVYQEVNLIPSLSVAENIALGRQPGRAGFIHWRAVRSHAREALARLGLQCDPDAEVGSLSLALQQMVAIARALDRQARLLILDEPTSSLDENEVAELFRVMRELRQAGMGIVFVTHFLDQVFAVCDRLTILRNGALVGEYPLAEIDRLTLVSRMLGREFVEAGPGQRAGATTEAAGQPLLSVRGLGRRGTLQPVDLEVRRGEVLGVAGLLGSGRTEAARLIYGADLADSGTMEKNGAPVRVRSPRDAVTLGLAFLSEDRKAEGILPNLSVRENLVVALQAKRGGLRALSAREQQALCEHYIQALRIKTASSETPICQLSGGNQQKVLIARWLATQPELIIFDEPTRGIDIGAKAEIEALVGKLRADGLAVIFISSEIEEVVRNSSRAIVLRERRQCAALAGHELTPTTLMQAMSGSSAHPPAP